MRYRREKIEKFAERKDRRDERENEELWENSETFGRRFGGPVFALSVFGQAGVWDAAAVVFAEENKDSVSANEIQYVERTSDRVITDDDRFDADEDLLYYMQSLEVRYHLDEKVMEGLHKLFDSAVYYIANTEMSLTELYPMCLLSREIWSLRR